MAQKSIGVSHKEVFGLLVSASSALYTMINLESPTDDRNIEPPDARSKDQCRCIYQIAWYLRQKLVPELIQPVIEHAGLFHRQTSTADHYRAIRISNSPSICLISTPICLEHRRLNAIRRVSFRVIAKDQGFAAYPGAGSWTWLTAGILKNGQGKVEQQREIMRNDSRCGNFVSHAIEWSVDSIDKEESCWVRSLKQGHQVVVQGWSKYHGWINFVNLVEVTILSSVIR